MREKEKKDEFDDKKVAVPPVVMDLHVTTVRRSILQQAKAQHRRKALPLHATDRLEIRVSRAARPLLARRERGRSRSSRKRTAPITYPHRLQRQRRERTGRRAGAAKNGHCAEGEERALLVLIVLFSYSPDLVALTRITARAVGGRSTGRRHPRGGTVSGIFSESSSSSAIPAPKGGSLFGKDLSEFRPACAVELGCAGVGIG